MHDLVSPVSAIGAIFTPIRWARWLIEKHNVLDRWIAGETICDPTSGKGAFMHALMDAALRKGVEVDDDALSRLFVIERQCEFLEAFEKEFRKRWGRSFTRQNIFQADIITENPDRVFDFLIGNPPWINFSDLPEAYKARLKSYFVNAGIVDDRKGLLLGNSRIDLAALVISTVLQKNLRATGEAAFFIPLSLFMNDGAHAGFRAYRLENSRFCVRELWNFCESNVFHNVVARYGAVRIIRDSPPNFPIPYNLQKHDDWVQRLAAPIGAENAPLSVVESPEDYEQLANGERIELRGDQKPRQGINTCGANNVFMFESIPVDLEEFVYPLITRKNFHERIKVPVKFILLPYDRITGQPLAERELQMHPAMWTYLLSHQAKLESRKGTMLGSWIRRGRWWACLGVGKYNFSSHKIVWEAYGKREFNPTVFNSFDGKPWQVNQALQAYIPCSGAAEAERIQEGLMASQMQRYLESMKSEGTCNWAQPGRIKRFLAFNAPSATEQKTLF